MDAFQFSKQMIDQHVIKYGADINPPLIVSEDRQIVQEFFNIASEKYPALFESLSQGPNEFVIKKKVQVGGKAIEVPTFAITPRGAVFTFPLAVPGIHREISWTDDLDTRVIDSLDELMKMNKAKHVVRLGKIHELIFDINEADSIDLVRNRFAPFLPEHSKEARIRWNEGDDQFNRVFQLEALKRQTVQVREIGGYRVEEAAESMGFGISLRMDVNNVNMQQPLDEKKQKDVIEHANEVYDNRVLEILNWKSHDE